MNTFLGYASLNNADLRGADLSEAYLEGTNLNFADLSDANLNVDVLYAVNLNGATLHKLYPKDKLGDLEVSRLCLGIDHHKLSRAGFKRLREWHKRFGERKKIV